MCDLKSKVVICLLGGPGSGKGTLSERIRAHYSNVGYMSAGELLRGAAAADTPEGRALAEQLRRGEIVPQEITIGLLREQIEKQNKDFYLIDGFPRQVDQAMTFENTVVSPKAVLFLSVPDDVLIKRLLNRGKTSGRSDDNEESIRLRINVYHTKCLPVNEYFGDRLTKINADRTPIEIFEEVRSLIDRILESNK